MEILKTVDMVATIIIGVALVYAVLSGAFYWASAQKWERKNAKARAEFWERVGTDAVTVNLKKERE